LFIPGSNTTFLLFCLHRSVLKTLEKILMVIILFKYTLIKNYCIHHLYPCTLDHTSLQNPATTTISKRRSFLCSVNKGSTRKSTAIQFNWLYNRLFASTQPTFIGIAILTLFLIPLWKPSGSFWQFKNFLNKELWYLQNRFYAQGLTT